MKDNVLTNNVTLMLEKKSKARKLKNDEMENVTQKKRKFVIKYKYKPNI